jgi:hypothetical protein
VIHSVAGVGEWVGVFVTVGVRVGVGVVVGVPVVVLVGVSVEVQVTVGVYAGAVVGVNEGVAVCVLVGDGVAVGVGVAQKNVVTGVRLFVLLALPSCPYVLSPQHCTVHESTHAQEKFGEDDTSSAAVMELTETGCQRSVVVPSPN